MQPIPGLFLVSACRFTPVSTSPRRSFALPRRLGVIARYGALEDERVVYVADVLEQRSFLLGAELLRKLSDGLSRKQTVSDRFGRRTRSLCARRSEG